MLQFFGILAGVIGLYSTIKYIQSIVQGKTKPQRMAWVLFITLSTISFVAQLLEGARASLWFPFVLFAGAVVIFSLSLKYGIGGSSFIDKLSLVLSICILLVWFITKSAAVAIVCTVTVNTIGKFLVAKKVYQHPDTEYLPTWVLSVIASALTAIAVGSWNWILLLPSVQNGITVGIITLIIYFRRSKPLEHASKQST